MPQIYRSMKVDGDKPLVENSAKGLGVRVGGGPNDDIPVTTNGEVKPGAGGMSVAPAWKALPIHRIPRRLVGKHPGVTGSNLCACWRMGSGPFREDVVAIGLKLKVESETHGLVEPENRTSLETYLNQLAATRDEWVIDEE